MKMVFNVAPKAVQSYKDGIIKDRQGNPRIIRYQPAEVREFKHSIAAGARAALGPSFKPWTGPIRTKTTFYIPVPKSLEERYSLASAAGVPLYVTSRPDLSDNLHKGFLDALIGILFVDDSLIVWEESRKVYGWPARIEFEAIRLDVDNEQQELF